MFTAGFLPPGIYGSSLAGTLIRDSITGRDSLDIVTIGDSNAGFSYGGFGGGGGGWSRGWLRALNALGAPTYSSPLMPIMVANSVSTATQIYKDDDGNTIGTIAGWFSNVTAPNGNLVRGSASGPTAIRDLAVPATSFMPYGLTNWDFGYINTGNNNQSFSQLNGTYPGGQTPNPALPSWTQHGTAVKYRLVYATQADQTSNSTRARLNPTAYRVDAGSYVSLATKAQNTYDPEGPAITTTDLDFTIPSSPANQAVIVGWNYIGTAYGPCSVLFDCIYKNAKGIAVNNLHYGSGQAPSTISDIITGAHASGKSFVVTYFKQIIARQIAAGGTGRAIVWINYGINPANSPESAATWTSKTADAIAFLKTQWSLAGGASDNLAFVTSVTHPLNTYGGTTESSLAVIRAAANLWAATQQNTTVIDLSQMFTPAQMTSNSYYAGPGSAGSNNEAHLSQSGYYNLALKFTTLLAGSA
jgi:hypothetical protein